MSDRSVFKVNKDLLTGGFLTDNGFIEKPACMILGRNLVYMNVYYKDDSKYVITIDSSGRGMIATKNNIITRLNSTLDDLLKNNGKLLVGNEQRYNDSIDACEALGGNSTKTKVPVPDSSKLQKHELEKAVVVNISNASRIRKSEGGTDRIKTMLIKALGEDNVSIDGDNISVEGDSLRAALNDANKFNKYLAFGSNRSSVNYYIKDNGFVIIDHVYNQLQSKYRITDKNNFIVDLTDVLNELKKGMARNKEYIKDGYDTLRYNNTVELYEKLGGKKGEYKRISSEKKKIS